MTYALVTLAVVGVLAWLVVVFVQRARLRTPERQLARMVGPDAAKRLIEFELKRNPALPRQAAAQHAIERAEYDRGR